MSDTFPVGHSPAIRANSPLFPLGRIVATPAILEHFEHHGVDLHTRIDRHRHGDWGNISAADAEANEIAVRQGSRILSAYLVAGRKVWIITEADRSATTVLFPSEY